VTGLGWVDAGGTGQAVEQGAAGATAESLAQAGPCSTAVGGHGPAAVPSRDEMTMGPMTTGRKPRGEIAMTGAERQARYRARLAGTRVQPQPPTPASQPRRHGRQRRWDGAIATLRTVQAEYAEWLETMPEQLHDTPTGQALQAVVELDLDEIAFVYLPKGYGRD
jgi:hypothetical protein